MIWKKFRIQRNDCYPYTGWTGTRHDLAEMFNDLGYKKGAEIGVQRGRYSQALCDRIPGLDLMSIDPWVPFHLISAEKQEKCYAEAVERLTPYGVKIIKKPSMEAVKDVPDGSLDFVYIDGDHSFDGAMLDMIYWTPKVRLGGIVAGHDYIVAHQCSVIHAVDAYTRAHNISQVYVLSEYGDHHAPSFFWVREKGQG
jgi:Methyltransferase domain